MPSTICSQVNNSPSIPVESVNECGQKLFKVIGNDGKVQVFRASLDESASGGNISNVNQDVRSMSKNDNFVPSTSQSIASGIESK